MAFGLEPAPQPLLTLDVFVLSESGAPHGVNQINTQLNGRLEGEEYHSFQNKLSLGAGGSHTGISESLKLVGNSCQASFPLVENSVPTGVHPLLSGLG